MNVQQMARSAYRTAGNQTRPNRHTEYEVIARVTHQIKQAMQQGPLGFPELAKALHQNRRLWTMLAADVADSDNGLPQDVRARIFYLAEFTLTHTGKVLGGEASATPLLEINTAILKGLRQTGARK